MQQKIKVGVVGYLNTKPLVYGLQHLPVKDKIELVEGHPARIADLLISKEIDLGLVPVAVLPEIGQYYIVGDYCIGADGEVASVCLFSEVPLAEIKQVYLDYQSRSSVALLKWIMQEYWGINAEFIDAENEDFRNKIKGTSAGLVIGDRAFEQRKVSTFIYDLGQEWKKITGLPFVFAAWVSNKELAPDFIEEFNKANALGLTKLDEIVAAHPFDLYNLKKYFTIHISYVLDERKKRGMKKFLELVSEYNLFL